MLADTFNNDTDKVPYVVLAEWLARERRQHGLGVDSKQDERHVHRTARMGAQVVTSGTWYYQRTRTWAPTEKREKGSSSSAVCATPSFSDDRA